MGWGRLINKGVNEIDYADWERRANVHLIFNLNIEEIAKHPTVASLFEKLQTKKLVSDKDADAFAKRLVENYQKKFKKENIWETVSFHIKNNILWKDDKPDFYDIIHHEIFIPYEYKKDEKEESSIFDQEIEKGLKVRLLVVNGAVRVQIGNFSKEYTPRMLREGGLAVYQTYQTITTFPLFYFSYQHEIPEKYLNLNAEATEAWKNLHSDKKSDEKKDFTSDWHALVQEVQEYKYVCKFADDEELDDPSKWQAIVKKFNEKKDALCSQEGFKNFFAREGNDAYDDWWDSRHIGNDIYYGNKYLTVDVKNVNDLMKRYSNSFTDYYEEMP